MSAADGLRTDQLRALVAAEQEKVLHEDDLTPMTPEQVEWVRAQRGKR